MTKETKMTKNEIRCAYHEWLLIAYGVALILLSWWVVSNNYSEKIEKIQRIIYEELKMEIHVCDDLFCHIRYMGLNEYIDELSTRQNLLYEYLELEYIEGENEYRPARIEQITKNNQND